MQLACVLTLLCAAPALASAQSAPARLAFDVASVRQNTSSDTPSTSVPLTKGDFYPPNHGVFTARAMPLINFLNFAYKLSEFQKRELLAHAPEWIATDRFNIEARSDANPNKDQMRQMMQSLLAERFHLAVHHEMRQVPIFALVLAKPGILGPRLHAHVPNDPACARPEAHCGGFGLEPPTVPGSRHLVGRGVPLQQLADELPGLASLNRPLFDHTGVAATVDFELEFVPEPSPNAPAPATEPSGPSFLEALRNQLGLRMESTKGPVDFVLIDHVDRPTPN